MSDFNNQGLRPIPIWETHDSTEYVDWSKAERVRFPKLEPSSANPPRAARGGT